LLYPSIFGQELLPVVESEISINYSCSTSKIGSDSLLKMIISANKNRKRRIANADSSFLVLVIVFAVSKTLTVAASEYGVDVVRSKTKELLKYYLMIGMTRHP
jgi:hypothetical protein